MLRGCTVFGSRDAGVRAVSARTLSIEHATIAGNGTGLVLERGCVNATVRDSIVAGSGPALRVSPESRPGLLISDTGTEDVAGPPALKEDSSVPLSQVQALHRLVPGSALTLCRYAGHAHCYQQDPGHYSHEVAPFYREHLPLQRTPGE